jgi:hypothetical protein
LPEAVKPAGRPRGRQTTAIGLPVGGRYTPLLEISSSEEDTTLPSANSSPSVSSNIITVDDDDNGSPLDSLDKKCWLKCGPFTLTQQHRGIVLGLPNVLLEDEFDMLDDTLVNAAQHMIRCAYPGIDGLNDTILVAYKMVTRCSRYVAGRPFIQILHTPKHWVMIYSRPDQPGTFRLRDSLHGTVSKAVITQTSQLCSATSFRLVKDTQHPLQRGAHDCGLHAIANALEVARGHYGPVRFDDSRLRSHFLSSLESKALLPFPKHA